MVPIPLNCTGWLPAGLPLLARSMLFLAKKKKKKKKNKKKKMYGVVTSPQAWASSWLGWNKWYWQVHCSQSSGWKTQT
jgi:hypothetical protein